MKRSTKRKIELVLVLAFSLLAFRKEVRSAYLWRGYHAMGGEYLMLLFPVVYYLLRSTVLAYWNAFRRFMLEDDRPVQKKSVHATQIDEHTWIIRVPKPKFVLRKTNRGYKMVAN